MSDQDIADFLDSPEGQGLTVINFEEPATPPGMSAREGLRGVLRAMPQTGLIPNEWAYDLAPAVGTAVGAIGGIPGAVAGGAAGYGLQRAAEAPFQQAGYPSDRERSALTDLGVNAATSIIPPAIGKLATLPFVRGAVGGFMRNPPVIGPTWRSMLHGARRAMSADKARKAAMPAVPVSPAAPVVGAGDEAVRAATGRTSIANMNAADVAAHSARMNPAPAAPTSGTRTVIVGAPRTGKTTLAKTLSEAPFHADDVKGLGWSEASERTAQEIGKSEVVEGAAAARALRKWLLNNPTGKPAEEVIFLRHPYVEQSAGQQSMGKGIETVFKDIRGELQRRGVKITEPPAPKAPAVAGSIRPGAKGAAPKAEKVAAPKPKRPSQAMRGASGPELSRRAAARAKAAGKSAGPVLSQIEQSIAQEQALKALNLPPASLRQARVILHRGGNLDEIVKLVKGAQ